MLDDGFGHWLAGFTDGEGCFYIRPVATAYSCEFVIGLRPDDRPILEEIAMRTGFGLIRDHHGTGAKRDGSQSRWEVCRKADCASLVAIFDRFPLRAKKARDFAIWREAVAEHAKIKVRRRSDWTRVAELKALLQAQRKYDAPTLALPVPTPATQAALAI